MKKLVRKRIVKRVKRADPTNDRGQTHHKVMAEAVEKVRQQLTKSEPRCISSMALQLHRTISSQLDSYGLHDEGLYPGESETDEVLAHVIDSLMSPRTYAPSEEMYAELDSHLNDYEMVFGDLIADEVRHLRGRRAQFKYDNGLYSSAAAEWSIYRSRAKRALAEDRRGISTGLKALDDAVYGLEGLAVLGGDRGVGKSTLASQIIVAALKADERIAAIYYSLDMPKDRIFDRLLCYEAGVTFREYRSRSTDIAAQIEKASELLETSLLKRLRVIDRFTHEQDEELSDVILEHREALLNNCSAEHVLVVVDLFQDIPVPREVLSDSLDHYRLDAIHKVQRRTQTAAHPYGDSFLVVSEIRKQDGNHQHLRKDDLLGSSHIASKASTILLLWKNTEGEAPGSGIAPATLNIAKGRDGVIRRDIELDFDFEHYRFFERRSNGGPSAATRTATAAPTTKRKAINPLAGGKCKPK